jgi:hypothetical protein
MEFLKVANWRKNQTYRKDRGTPPWIKVKRSLLSSAKWAMLNDAQKGHLVSIWLVAAEREGIVPADPEILRKICALDVAPDTEFLIDVGFLASSGCQHGNQLTTEAPASDGHVTGQETETETETEGEKEKKVLTRDQIKFPKAAEPFFRVCKDNGVFNEALDWLTVLKRKKAAMTANAWDRRLRKLEDLSKREPAAIILARSADAGWSDLYGRNEKSGGSNGKRETAVQRRERQAREALGN